MSLATRMLVEYDFNGKECKTWSLDYENVTADEIDAIPELYRALEPIYRALAAWKDQVLDALGGTASTGTHYLLMVNVPGLPLDECPNIRPEDVDRLGNALAQAKGE